MTEPTVLYQEHGAVAQITLNRPANLNSLNLEMHQALWRALDQAESNSAIRALVLTGAGRGFCAGADLSSFDFSEGPNRIERADPGPVIERSFNPTTRRLMRLRMPAIAAINGVARGAGVAQDQAHVFIACCRRLGVPARYVSGYLRTRPPEGKARLVGADASHAWFSAFCPDLGWVDFDPTNNTPLANCGIFCSIQACGFMAPWYHVSLTGGIEPR